MAKKTAKGRPLIDTESPPAVGHARIELPIPLFDRLRWAADRLQLGISAYVRQAVIERIEADEIKAGKKP